MNGCQSCNQMAKVVSESVKTSSQERVKVSGGGLDKLVNLEFEEKRALIASSLTLTDFVSPLSMDKDINHDHHHDIRNKFILNFMNLFIIHLI